MNKIIQSINQLIAADRVLVYHTKSLVPDAVPRTYVSKVTSNAAIVDSGGYCGNRSSFMNC